MATSCPKTLRRLTAAILAFLLSSAGAPHGLHAAGRVTRFAAETCGVLPGDTIAVVPASVRTLPPYAFADMESLREVRFAGEALSSVGEYAFLGCASLERMRLPDSVTEMGEGCLRECVSLRSFRFPRSVRKLPRFVCEWDSLLTDISLPPRLEDIGSHAFAYCSSLSRVEIPAGVTHIGSNVFSFCSSLEEIKVPDSVTELESYAFSECVSLRRAVLPANHSLLGELIFSGCVSLTELVEPSPVPPEFDCSSFIFEPDETELYRRCRLVVPEGREDAYRKAPGWSLFFPSR